MEERAQAERFSALLRAAADLSIIGADLSGVVTVFSEGAERMLGYRADEVVGKVTPMAFHDPDEVAARAAELGMAPGFEALVAVARREGAETREWSYVRKDGSRLVVSLTIATIHGAGGEVTGFIGIAHDITGRKRAEAELARLSHQNQLILDSAAEGIFGLDRDGNITFVNPAAARMTGYEVHELIGRPLHETVHHTRPDGTPWPREECSTYAVLRDGAIHHVTGEVAWKKDGTSFPVEYVSSPIQEGGKIVGAVVIFMDVTQRKQAEAEQARLLRQAEAAEAKFRALLESAPDAIIAVDGDGRIVLVNSQTEKLYGYRRDELLGQPIEVLIPERYRDDHAAARARYYADPGVLPMGGHREVASLRKDGSEFLAEVSLNLLKTEEGPLVITVVRDITERKRAEEERARFLAWEQAARAEAEAARRRFAFLAEATTLLASSLDYEVTLQRVARLAVPVLADICIVDIIEDDSIRQVAVAALDPAKEKLLEEMRYRYPPDPSGPHPVMRVLHTGQAELYPEIPDSLLVSYAHDAEHLAMIRQLGFRSRITVPFVARGRTLGAISFILTESDNRYGPAELALAEDLARRAALAVDNARLYREAQEALNREQSARAEAEKLAAERAAILGQIGDAVIIADPSGRITFANEAARRLYGVSRTTGSIQEFEEVYRTQTVDWRQRGPHEWPLARAAVHGEPVVDAEMRIRRPDGTEVVAQGNATPVVTEDGSRLGGVLTLHDVTAQRDLERQKDEFFASVSHDLRTPLAAIKASIGVVLANEPPATPEPIHRMLTNIDLAADRMSKLVDDILELTRLQAGRVQLRLSQCDLRMVALRSARAIEPLAQERGQRLEVRLPQRPLQTMADAERIERALLNLLSNAQKYGRAGGTITLSLEERDGEAVFGVADDGPGIPEAYQDRIFERFYRRETEATARNQGSGLGLPIARAMVELHGGRIWVESGQGAGTTFWFTLPIASGELAEDKDGGL